MILYSTGCSKCKVLSKRLDQAGVKYDICNDVERMTDLGITSLPVLEVDGRMMNFIEAFSYASSLGRN